jgi:hypothetical protein
MPNVMAIFFSQPGVMGITITIAADIDFRLPSPSLDGGNGSDHKQIHKECSSDRGCRSNSARDPLHFDRSIPLYAGVVQHKVRQVAQIFP